MSALLVVVDEKSCSKCNTCKAAFADIEKVKEHYRSDWHVFNSKRRANGLAPLRKEDFKLLVGDRRSSTKGSVSTQVVSVSNLEDANNKDGNSNVSEVEATVAKKVYIPKTSADVSIFDDKEFDSVDECVQYMSLNFGFFLPDVEYLCDLEGLIKYLNEKVKLGGYCLYCQKQFQPGYATQHHMQSKSHCKIAYENGVDGEEFEDFYDFSASYEDVEEGEIEFDENGEIVEKSSEILRTGELKLPNGKVVGHRDFRIYYKQHYRPEETRPSVLVRMFRCFICIILMVNYSFPYRRSREKSYLD
jgi:pre-60S factor REI1